MVQPDLLAANHKPDRQTIRAAAFALIDAVLGERDDYTLADLMKRCWEEAARADPPRTNATEEKQRSKAEAELAARQAEEIVRLAARQAEDRAKMEAKEKEQVAKMEAKEKEQIAKMEAKEKEQSRKAEEHAAKAAAAVKAKECAAKAKEEKLVAKQMAAAAAAEVAAAAEAAAAARAAAAAEAAAATEAAAAAAAAATPAATVVTEATDADPSGRAKRISAQRLMRSDNRLLRRLSLTGGGAPKKKKDDDDEWSDGDDEGMAAAAMGETASERRHRLALLERREEEAQVRRLEAAATINVEWFNGVLRTAGASVEALDEEDWAAFTTWMYTKSANADLNYELDPEEHADSYVDTYDVWTSSAEHIEFLLERRTQVKHKAKIMLENKRMGVSIDDEEFARTAAINQRVARMLEAAERKRAQYSRMLP